MTSDVEAGELIEQQKLLDQVFPQALLSRDYLAWLYQNCPDGANVASDYSEAGKLLGHYSVIPQRWKVNGQSRLLALSLNTAVHAEARGKGLFVQLAEETYSKAVEGGVQAIIGVANANSTPGFTRRLGFTLVTPLPVVSGVSMPMRPRGTTSHEVTSEFLCSDEFSAIVGGLRTATRSGMEQDWTLNRLRWRLASPRSRYAVHNDRSGVLITTSVVAAAGVRIVIVLKLLPRQQEDGVETARLLRAAAAHHRSPFYVYSGFNSSAKLTGLPLPRRLLPSPLNLIYRRLDASMPEAQHARFSTFEFLDFDAY